MRKRKLSELVLDFDLYPRGSVDGYHVAEIAAAMEAGSEMPPIVIDKESKRVVDGFHRWKAYRRHFGEDHEVSCVEKKYENEAAMFVEAMKYNASHGRALTQHDKTHCAMLADKLGISLDVVSESLNLTVSRVETLTRERVSGGKGLERIPLKRTIRHMSGKKLNKRQVEANKKFSGMEQQFYVNQVIELIESDLLDTGNVELMQRLEYLVSLCQTKIAA